MTFDYIEAVRQEVANRPSGDPAAIARAVALRIPPSDYLPIIERLLLPVVAGAFGSADPSEMRHLGATTQPKSPPADPFTPRPANPVRTSGMGAWPSRKPPADEYVPDEDELPPLPRKPVERPKNGPVTVRHQPPAPAAPSRWAGPQGHGSNYRQWLDSIVNVAGSMKRRRDCTRADVRALIDSHLAGAGREERLLHVMQAKGVRIVGDLPETALTEFLTEAASCR